MIFTILRRLKHSELGMFHAYRKLGKEGSKQRAINFDGDVVDRVFPSAKNEDQIKINCIFQEDAATVSSVQQWLKRQEKNWRFEGNCPKSDYYDFVEPGCLFAMMVDAGVTPATASWVVIPETHVSYHSILDHAESGGLASAGMIALYGDECAHVCRVLGDHYPALFKPAPDVLPPTINTDMAPHPLGTFMILANAGHDLPSAVADLVDNSIAAGATEIDITFPNPNDGGRWMCVRDNGSGMTFDELRSAMRIGNPRDYESRDLGKYGFGLKGASWSQADTMTVISRKLGKLNHLTWDRAHLEKTGQWETLSEEIPEQYQYATDISSDSGTAVLLTNMRPPAKTSTVRDVDPYTVEISELRAHLGLVFHRFLTGNARGRNTITISINGTLVPANNPVDHPLTRPHNQRQIKVQIGEDSFANIYLQAFVLPTEDQLKQYHSSEGELAAREAQSRLSLGGRMNASQGLYFYRVDRLIKWGGWCGVYAEDEHTKLLRVIVDFDRSADETMKINISKKEVQLSVTLKDEIKVAVKDGRSDARSRYDGKPPKGKQSKSKSGPAVPKLPIRENGPQYNGPDLPNGGAENASSETTPNNKTSGVLQKPPEKATQVNIRFVSMETKWQQILGFQKETILEISESFTPLVSLAKSIENNTDAKRALAEFLKSIEGKLND